jgi:hypothetical protein
VDAPWRVHRYTVSKQSGGGCAALPIERTNRTSSCSSSALHRVYCLRPMVPVRDRVCSGPWRARFLPPPPPRPPPPPSPPSLPGLPGLVSPLMLSPGLEPQSTVRAVEQGHPLVHFSSQPELRCVCHKSK